MVPVINRGDVVVFYLDLEQVTARECGHSGHHPRLFGALGRDIVDSQWVWVDNGLSVGEGLKVDLSVWCHDSRGLCSVQRKNWMKGVLVVVLCFGGGPEAEGYLRTLLKLLVLIAYRGSSRVSF